MPKNKNETPLWSVGETSTLRNLAAIGLDMKETVARLPGRSRREVKDRLAELEIELHPKSIADIRRAGRKGVVFLREDVGGQIGVRWLCAHRSGAAFDTRKMEALDEIGMFAPALRNRAPIGPDHFVWKAKD